MIITKKKPSIMENKPPRGERRRNESEEESVKEK